jgi:H(+)-transporting ATP synthase subunit D
VKDSEQPAADGLRADDSGDGVLDAWIGVEERVEAAIREAEEQAARVVAEAEGRRGLGRAARASGRGLVSGARRSAPTRHALPRLRQRLDRVRTATGLLTRKRRALVAELFRAARPVLDAREAIEWPSAVAYASLLQAEADRGGPRLEALALPVREIGVELAERAIWGLPCAEIVAHDPVRRPAAERGFPPGASGPAAVSAADAFERLVQLLLDATSRELRIRRLPHALAETSRRVNRLERRVAPALEGEPARIASTLEEREREEQLRHRRLLDRPGAR